jgi:hypothetical protein
MCLFLVVQFFYLLCRCNGLNKLVHLFLVRCLCPIPNLLAVSIFYCSFLALNSEDKLTSAKIFAGEKHSSLHWVSSYCRLLVTSNKLKGPWHAAVFDAFIYLFILVASILMERQLGFHCVFWLPLLYNFPNIQQFKPVYLSLVRCLNPSLKLPAIL